MGWFLYDNGLCHEKVKKEARKTNIFITKKSWKISVFLLT